MVLNPALVLNLISLNLKGINLQSKIQILQGNIFCIYIVSENIDLIALCM